ncbi:hypothetical protein PG997_014961 [Apiospora hydei]|uniref:Rhodopsin domain-containing protein n=1 Tax=Apiospora hydei TaxID=1337664 RepID=A0ABR1UVA2_9PEZI
MIDGRGGETLVLVWTLSGVSLLMVLLRMYTRVAIVRSIGADDYAYATAGHIHTLSPDDAASAVFWEIMCQAAAVISMALAKISLALFLLRIVVVAWHKIAIWTSIISLSIISTSASVVLWTQCRPVNKIWDRERVGGYLRYSFDPSCNNAWILVCGGRFLPGHLPLVVHLEIEHAKATVELGGLDGPDFTYKTAPLVIWSAVEIAVTMVCIVIPVIRPLYRTISESARSSSSYQKHGAGRDLSQRDSSVQLRTIEGSSVDGAEYLSPNDLLKRDMRLGLRTLSITHIVSNKPSQEEMLRDEYQNSVKVTDEVSVSRE